MKKIILVIIFFVAVFNLSAQQITIQDKETKEALPFVTISNPSDQSFAITDENGKVDISHLQNAITLEIQNLGYEVLTTSYSEIIANQLIISLEKSTFSLGEITVSATRWQQEINDNTAKVSSISQQEIALQNPQTSADMLGKTGEVYIQKSQQGGGSPMIRGFAANRLLYTVDGVRMNTAIFRSGNIQNVISLDAFTMENTEVYFGASSVIYGSDAIGGVMSFQTLKPTFSTNSDIYTKGSTTIRYATANQEKTGHFDLNMGWKKWASVTSFSYNDFGDLRMGKNGADDYLNPYVVERINNRDTILSNENPLVQNPSGYTQLNIMQKLRFSPNDKWDFQYGFHFSETSEYGRYDRHILYKNELPRYGQWDYGPQKWMINNLTINHHGMNPAYDDFALRIAHQSFEESRISRDINDNTREIRKENVDAYSINTDFLKKIKKKHTLYYGAEIIINKVQSEGTNQNISTLENAKGAARYPDALWSSYALYVSDKIDFSEKIQLQAGFRYNHFIMNADFDTTFYPIPFTEAKISNGAATGSIGFLYKPTNKWAIGINAATAFRAPNVDDAGKVFDSEPGAVVVPNVDLKAEYAYNVDVNLAKIFANRLKVDFSAYYTHLTNALVRRNFQLNGQDSILYDGELSQVQAIQNAAKAKVYGIQAGIELKIYKGLSLQSQINWQKGDEEQNDGSISASRHAAPLFGQTKFMYKNKALLLAMSIIYNGERTYEDLPIGEQAKSYLYAKDENNNPYSPRWYTLNFVGQYSFEKGISINLGIENLTDRRYRPYSSGLAGAGRNIVMSIRADF